MRRKQLLGTNYSGMEEKAWWNFILFFCCKLFARLGFCFRISEWCIINLIVCECIFYSLGAHIVKLGMIPWCARCETRNVPNLFVHIVNLPWSDMHQFRSHCKGFVNLSLESTVWVEQEEIGEWMDSTITGETKCEPSIQFI